MFTTVANQSIILYTMYWTFNEQTLINTYLYRIALKAGRPGPINYEDESNRFLAVQAATGLAFSVRSLVGNNANLDTHDFQAIAPTRLYVRTEDLNTQGLLDGGELPQNVAQVITRKAAVASRKGIGSVHLPPPTILEMTGGSWTQAHIDNMNLYAGEMLVTVDPPLSDCLYTPVLWTVGESNTLARPLITAFAQRTGRVMTRRTVGRGI